MRSQDAIFGMGNDAPCFSFIHELMWVRLRQTYPDLKLGKYWHLADSFHVYERHFDLVQGILENPTISKDMHLGCPPMSKSDDISLLRQVAQAPVKDLWPRIDAGIVEPGPFTRWLLKRDNPETLL
jgi:hypothetical protein